MVTTIIGTNSYARQQSVKVLVSDFIKKYGDIGYEHIDGENIALRSASKLTTKHTVFV